MTLYYDKEGEPYEELDVNQCFAKKVGSIYYARRVNKGDDSGKLLAKNMAIGKRNLEVMSLGQPYSSFRKITQKGFEEYLKYLRTSNMANLRIAEREQE